MTVPVAETSHSKLATMSTAAAMGGNPETVTPTAVPAAFAAVDDGAARVTAGVGGTRKLKSAGNGNSSCLAKDTLTAPIYSVGLTAPVLIAAGRTKITVADRGATAAPTATEYTTDTHDASGPAGPMRQVTLAQERFRGGESSTTESAVPP